MSKEEIKKIVSLIEAGQKLKDDTVIFQVPVETFEVYVMDNEHHLSVKAQKMLFDADKRDYYNVYAGSGNLSIEAFKMMLDANDESYFARYCWNNFFSLEQKKLIVSHKKALRFIELMMDNSGSETTQWLEIPEADVPFVKMEGPKADRVLDRYMRDNLPLSDEAQLALFEKKDAKKWVKRYDELKGLTGKAKELAKGKGWI